MKSRPSYYGAQLFCCRRLRSFRRFHTRSLQVAAGHQTRQQRAACPQSDSRQNGDPEAHRAAKTHRRRAGYPEKGRAVRCKGARLKYRFINKHRTVWGVMAMWRVLKVARAGSCAWRHHPVPARDTDNPRLLTLIRDSCSLNGGVYGYRRVHGDLNEIGEPAVKTAWAQLCH